MATITFDTHEFFITLKSSGFSDEQSEAIIRLQKASVEATLDQARHDFDLDEVATKRDLQALQFKLEARIKDTELKIAETKSELIRWVVGVGRPYGGFAIAIHHHRSQLTPPIGPT